MHNHTWFGGFPPLHNKPPNLSFTQYVHLEPDTLKIALKLLLG